MTATRLKPSIVPSRIWLICRLVDIHFVQLLVRGCPRTATSHVWRAYGYNGHRAEIHEVIYDYAVSIGVEIHFNHCVDGYFQHEAKGNAGVIVRGEIF